MLWRLAWPGVIGGDVRVWFWAWLWVFSSEADIAAAGGGFGYSPAASTAFGSGSGSVDGLQASARYGRSPLAAVGCGPLLPLPRRPAVEPSAGIVRVGVGAVSLCSKCSIGGRAD